MVASQRVVPPPPIQQPMIGPNGFLSPVWANWFNLFYRRAGDSEVTPVGDLEVQQAYDFDTLPSSVNRDLETVSKSGELQTAPSLGQIRLAMETFAALLETQGQNQARNDPDQEILQAFAPYSPRQEKGVEFDRLLAAETNNPRRYADEQFIPGMVNAVVNGGCLSSRRPAQSLTTSFVYGPVDLLAVKADGTVSAGTVEQVTAAYTLSTHTGHACWAKNMTLTGSASVHFRHRMESYLATRFRDKSANFSCRAYQDTGSAVDAIITISKADSSDDFSTVTTIDTLTISVPHDTNFSLEFAIPDMGDCKNGIEINIEFDTGAITTKNVYVGELQLSIGQQKRSFEYRSLQVEQRMIDRYLQKVVTFMSVANSGSNMQAMLEHQGMRASPSYTVSAALNLTDGYTADKSQSSSNIGTIHEQTADNARADIGNFSGLTSGRFYIKRGTSDHILASAEL